MGGEKVTLIMRFKNPIKDATPSNRDKTPLYVKFPFEITIRHNGNPLWVEHPDADVAVMYVPLPSSSQEMVEKLGTDPMEEFRPVSTNFLASDEKLARIYLHPGDEVMCLGFPLGLEVDAQAFPVLRSGKIASYPLLPTKKTKTFLYDAEVFQGNSGGPVYYVFVNRFYEGAIHMGWSMGIVGLISKEYLQAVKIDLDYEKSLKLNRYALAEVVHASFIKEAIEMLPKKPPGQ